MPTSIPNMRSVTLSLEKTLDLYLEGPDSWNQFVDSYDEIHFNFSKVQWPHYQMRLDALNIKQGLKNSVISFKGYCFKSGNLDFSGTDFGARSLDFSNLDLKNTSLTLADIVLHGPSINISNLKIGVGTIHLSGSRIGGHDRRTDLMATNISISLGDLLCRDMVFGKGDINFSGLQLNQGAADFSGTVFRDGDFSLSRAQIKGDIVDFKGSKFGAGSKFFSQCTFEVAQVSFSSVDFGTDNLDFHGCNYSKVSDSVNFRYLKTSGYSALFSMSTFAKITIDFSYSAFDCKIVDFSELDLADGNYIFESCEFSGRASFSDRAQQKSQAKKFSFRKSLFHSTLDVSWVTTEDIIDLRETKLATHTTLDNLGFTLHRTRAVKYLPGTLKTNSKAAASKLRRLKEIAETNKNHTAALRFHAAEMRARRWNDMPKLSSILDAAFSMLSNYGQSILRPFIAWGILVLGFGVVYSVIAQKDLLARSFSDTFSQANFADGFLYSLVQTLPVFPISRSLQQNLYTALNVGHSSTLFSSLTIVQNLLGVIFLFLIGLGLRNRFRL
ncbi:hypothetical protein [Rheinheimera hassiensis]|uniref:hypothetical protein n=1 Tax=Rheinheimera hassiensis TaxID=1193627 RepID=UPI001F054E95|nr:hypothetical protein [Rheinheimera hassiensis]